MSKSSYQIYSKKYKELEKVNTGEELFANLPDKKYQIIYADPPWDYGGKMQYDKSSIKSINKDFKREIFISSAELKYPTVKLSDLETLDVSSIADDNGCLLFMWTTGPQLEKSLELGYVWGFEYRTVGFVWNKMNHNPGHYTMSQTEFCLIFKRGKIPEPRGARNVKQLVEVERGKHSEKPEEVRQGIEAMFPSESKIELFAREQVEGWDHWGLEAEGDNKDIKTGIH